METTTAPTDRQDANRDDLLWQHLKTLPAFRALLRAVEARFYHQIPMPEPILDVGCGDGDFAQHTFNEYGRRINVGLDPWIGPLTKSREAGTYDQITQAFGNEMPFPDEYFSTAFSNSVLEHIPDIVPVLKETSRVLKPGGRFIMTMPNHRFTEMLSGAQLFERIGLDPLADRYRTLFNYISRHAHTEPIEWWADKLAQGGLAVERWQYYFSPDALRALEIGHAQGIPSAMIHMLTGKWIIAPTEQSLGPVDRWVRPHFLEQSDLDGCYQLIIARKVSNDPIVVSIPEAKPFHVLPNGDLEPEAFEAFNEDQEGSTHSIAWQADPNRESVSTRRSIESDLEASAEGQTAVSAGTSILNSNLIPIGAALLGLIFALGAYSFSSGPVSTGPAASILLWLIGIGVGYSGLALHAEEKPLYQRAIQRFRDNPNPFLIGLALFVAALALRLYNIGTHPFIMSGTEANIGLEARELAGGAMRNPFGTGAVTNPALPFYFIGQFLRFWGNQLLGLRFISAVMGALSVPVVYFAGHRFFSPTVGLSAALILLGNHLFFHYSRLGLTNIWDPFFVLSASLLVALAWQREERRLWLMAGLISGLSAYLFTASRVLPFVLLTLIVVVGLTDFYKLRRNLNHILVAALLCLIVTIPITRFYMNDPIVFTQRADQLGILQTNWIETTAAQNNQPTNSIWLDQIWRATSALWNADDLSTYYGAERGFFNFLTGVFLIVGTALCLRRLWQLPAIFLLAPVAITIIIGGVLLIETPSSHRYLIAIPFGAILTAIGIDWMIKRFIITNPESPRYRSLLLAGMLIIPLLLISADLLFYFGVYRSAEPPPFGDRNTEIAHRVADYLNTLDSSSNHVVYFHAEPAMYASFPTLPFLAPQFENGIDLIDVPLLNGNPHPFAGNSGPLTVILLPERANDRESVEAAFPGITLQSEVSGEFQNPLFYIYELNINN
ncbi:MAG: methyltransferase domain-containing protein [Chloroflexota bacterium]